MRLTALAGHRVRPTMPRLVTADKDVVKVRPAALSPTATFAAVPHVTGRQAWKRSCDQAMDVTSPSFSPC